MNVQDCNSRCFRKSTGSTFSTYTVAEILLIPVCNELVEVVLASATGSEISEIPLVLVQICIVSSLSHQVLNSDQ